MLDLAGVSFCDSSGLGVLAGIGKTADSGGGKLALARVPERCQLTLKRTGGIVENRTSEIVIRLNRRTCSPILRQVSLPETITVPWWDGRTLRYQYA